MDVTATELRRRLEAHLEQWLGAWPPRDVFTIIGSPRRLEPAWDGSIRRVVGIATPEGSVLSLPPSCVADAQAILDSGGLASLGESLGDLVGLPGRRLGRGVFRFMHHLVDFPSPGIWLPTSDPRVPAWLHPFNGDVLVVLGENGKYAAGVGIKRHDAFGHELAVVTEPEHQGKGLAQQLVAQAARRVFEQGAIATYLHKKDNFASAAVATAAGFPDVGWEVLGLPAAS